jgi:hypothetical protein
MLTGKLQISNYKKQIEQSEIPLCGINSNFQYQNLKPKMKSPPVWIFEFGNWSLFDFCLLTFDLNSKDDIFQKIEQD